MLPGAVWQRATAVAIGASCGCCCGAFGVKRHTRLVKTRLAIWLGVELLVASVISAGSCILRRDQVRAWRVWHDTPTPETRAELDKQHNVTARYHVVFASILWGGMATITIPIVVAVSRRKSSKHESETLITD